MARIMCLDYGTKKIGVAVTDPLQLIASPLETVETSSIIVFLENYFGENEVETLVIGEPLHPDGQPAQIHGQVLDFYKKLEKKFPTIELALQDERNSSKNAKQVILQSGAKRKKRQDKTLVDKVSASLILQDYMQEIGKW